MKILKKIAPLAIGAMMTMMPFAAALNIADWKDTFTSSSTAVVVGSGTIGTEDMAAALTVAKAVGIDTNTPTVGGESYKFEKSSKKLTLLTAQDDLYDIRTSLNDEYLPTTLADETYLDDNNDEFDYTQEISLVQNSLMLNHFADRDYNDKEPVLGFLVDDGDAVFNYTMEFTSTGPDCGADIESTTIKFLGKEYYVINDVDDDCATIDFLDSGEAVNVVEGETKTIGGKSVQIQGVYDAGSTYEAVMIVDGVETKALEEGDTYKLSDGTYIGMKDIRYNSKEAGKSSVVMSLGSGKIEFANATREVLINEEEVDGLTYWVDSDGTTLSGFTIMWSMDDDGFITTDSSITLPGLGGVSFMTTGMTFPDGEIIEPVADGTDTFVLNVPIKDGDAEIPILYDGDTANGAWGYIGDAQDSLLITDHNSDGSITLNESVADNFFVISYNTTQEGESYYVEPVIDEDDSDNSIISLKNVLTGKWLCVDKEATETCEFGDIEITVNAVSDTTQVARLTVASTSSMSFNRLFSDLGAQISLPLNSSINSTNQTATWNLVIKEADKDDNLARGSTITIALGFNDDDEAQIDSITESVLSGTDMFETSSGSKVYVGYVASDLASKIEYDTNPTQDTALVTYYGEQVYSNTYVTGAGATTGNTSWTAVRDSETSAYTSKNVIAIGGTAVNKVARKIIGLTDLETPVYGSDPAWASVTGVDAVGKGILWIKPNVYTTGKYAMLVAGYEGADTEKTANFLTISGSTLAKEKAILNTAGTAVVEATA
jgi:hypothetical protein